MRPEVLLYRDLWMKTTRRKKKSLEVGLLDAIISPTVLNEVLMNLSNSIILVVQRLSLVKDSVSRIFNKTKQNKTYQIITTSK